MDMRLRENKKLMEAENQVMMFRAQGSVGILDTIKELRSDLRQYERDVIAGKIKPLKEE